MMTTCVKLLNPLSHKLGKTLYRVTALAEGRGLPVLLVGASARDILFWHVHGLEPGRATMDLDISIQSPDWKAYSSFGETLLQNGFARLYEDHPEKLVDRETDQELDLLPFGEIAEDGRTIIWPHDNSAWSVIGLQDAFEHPLRIEVTDDDGERVVRFASAAALVMLKMVAVHDRPEARHKRDSTDIGFVIANYLEIGNRERLRTTPNDGILSAVGGDLDLASALLLGRDISAIASAETRAYLLELLEREVSSQSRCHLARGLQRSYCKGDFVRARRILRQLAAGMAAG